MRRSAATRICSPISCGGCSRTAPTPRSSTASSTSRQPIDEIIADPIARLAQLPAKPHPRIPLPRDLYRAGAARIRRARPRRSARRCAELRDGLAAALRRPWRAGADRRRHRAAPAPPRRCSIRATAGARSASVVDGRRRRRSNRRSPRAARAAPSWDATPAASARRDARARRRSLRARTAPS